MQTTPARYDLASLVPGEENILAISGALKVLEEPGERFNPLFIHGPSSAGKTHLLYALLAKIQETYPKWNVLALPAGEFLEECEHAWQNNTTPEFRQHLWHLNALLIDDVHLLANRPAALEEIYHAFNRLLADSRQLVLSSRLAPNELADFPVTLRTRFQSGLVVGLESPRQQLMRDIIVQSLHQRGIRPTRKATNFLCRELRGVRDLQGLIHQIETPCNGRPRRLSVKELRGLLEQHSTRQLTIADVCKATCQYFQAEVAKVRSASRQAALVQARQMAMYLARELTSSPLVAIGAYFSGRDHTTVLHACRKIADELRADPGSARAARDIRDLLRDG